MTADPEARGDQWRRAPGAYGNRGLDYGMHGDGMYTDGTNGGRRRRAGRGRRGVAILALILGIAGFAASMAGVAIQLLPRHFTAGEQRQIEAWEVMRRWQTLPAGQIFPASVSYQLSATVLQDTAPLELDALRIGIAPQESDCTKAVTAVAGRVLRAHGCEAVLRATYVDTTRSYVMTVGVAVLPNQAAADSADSSLSQPRLAAAHGAGDIGRLQAGVLVVRFAGRGTGLYDYNRQISASFTAGPYIVMYAAGYSDSRPRVPVSQDNYSDSEMTSMALGVAQSVANTLTARPAVPHCPGASAC